MPMGKYIGLGSGNTFQLNCITKIDQAFRPLAAVVFREPERDPVMRQQWREDPQA